MVPTLLREDFLTSNLKVVSVLSSGLLESGDSASFFAKNRRSSTSPGGHATSVFFSTPSTSFSTKLKKNKKLRSSTGPVKRLSGDHHDENKGSPSTSGGKKQAGSAAGTTTSHREKALRAWRNPIWHDMPQIALGVSGKNLGPHLDPEMNLRQAKQHDGHHYSSFFISDIGEWMYNLVHPDESEAVLKPSLMCENVDCRNTVAELGGSAHNTKFVRDRGGVKWKCGARDLLGGISRRDHGFACAELDCRLAPHYPIVNHFRKGQGCPKPFKITTVDGKEVEAAPTEEQDYEKVEVSLHGSCTESSLGGREGEGFLYLPEVLKVAVSDAAEEEKDEEEEIDGETLRRTQIPKFIMMGEFL